MKSENGRQVNILLNYYQAKDKSSLNYGNWYRIHKSKLTADIFGE